MDETNESPDGDDRAARAEVMLGPGRVRFPDISPRAYEHPADRGALATLRTVDGFAAVIKAVSGMYAERAERLAHLASTIRVGPKQYPDLDRIRNECAAILDIDPIPELYVYRSPVPNSVTLGLDEPFIGISTGLVELLDSNALMFVIGHEMGHVLSGHAVYRTLLNRLIWLSLNLAWLPIGSLALRAVIYALREWYRKAELSADRAGLLCAQDAAAAMRTHVLLAGANSPGDVDTAEFLKQARDYESFGDIRDSVLKLTHVMPLTHPLAVVRADELQRWAASEEYRAILAGEYPRRGDQPHANWTDDVKSAAKSYRDSFRASADPLNKILNEASGLISETAGKVFGRFGGGNDSGSGSNSGSGSDSASGAGSGSGEETK